MLPLFLLLSAPAVGAVGRETPQQVLWTTQSLTAHAVGAERFARVEGSTETLVFDSFTGAGAVTTTTGSPRTFMGMPVNLDGAAGNDPAISKAVVYLAYTGTAAQTYNSLRVQVQFWSDWSSTGNPVFSNPAAALSAFDVTGPVTLSPNTYTAITLPFATPIPFTGLNAHGVVINFQGDTGSGLASSDNLTTLLRYGPTRWWRVRTGCRPATAIATPALERISISCPPTRDRSDKRTRPWWYSSMQRAAR
jgi:hypothetical protein